MRGPPVEFARKVACVARRPNARSGSGRVSCSALLGGGIAKSPYDWIDLSSEVFGIRPFIIPEVIKVLADFRNDLTKTDQFQIAKIGLLVNAKVVVSHVAATNDGQAIVHDDRLIVHTVVDAVEVHYEPQHF